MSRERPKRGVLPLAQENIEKLKKVVEEGNYYGAQQMYKSISARYVSPMKNACFIADMSLLRGIWKLWIYFIQVPAFNWNMGRNECGIGFIVGYRGIRGIPLLESENSNIVKFSNQSGTSEDVK
ncbi:uncharacterized protein LOC21396094 isoform X1 [Morus notabilis]|uniref:uncharacterized protein LOC21396094 isoform X1 n=1 Tax=Morus notabilis TaxID=981085 RepID=UPI000CED5E5D|nr:uncharacterized protein LOC21396094 isoform X1 [Morus notabilis]